jgi:hypothetical protein
MNREGALVREDIVIQPMIEAIFEVINSDERDGNNAIFASGYGSGPIIVDVSEVAIAAYRAIEDIETRFL